MRFNVSGSRAGSGQSVRLLVEAPTASAAKWVAWRYGVMATRVKPANQPLPPLLPELLKALNGRPPVVVEFDASGQVADAWDDPLTTAHAQAVLPAEPEGLPDTCPSPGDFRRPVFQARRLAVAAGLFWLFQVPVWSLVGITLAIFSQPPVPLAIFPLVAPAIAYLVLAGKMGEYRLWAGIALLVLVVLHLLGVLFAGAVSLGLLVWAPLYSEDLPGWMFRLLLCFALCMVLAFVLHLLLIIRLSQALRPLAALRANRGQGFEPIGVTSPQNDTNADLVIAAKEVK